MRHMIFGESHGPAIGVVVEGVPAGLALDLEEVQRELASRHVIDHKVKQEKMT